MKMMRGKIEMKSINKPINTKTNCLCKSSKEQICNRQWDDFYDNEFDEDDERKDWDEKYQ